MLVDHIRLLILLSDHASLRSTRLGMLPGNTFNMGRHSGFTELYAESTEREHGSSAFEPQSPLGLGRAVLGDEAILERTTGRLEGSWIGRVAHR